MRAASPLLVLATSPLLLALGSGCGGATPPTMEGRDGMLSRTAVAQKCEEAAKGHDRPFVVEWDATDLASFEARAKQATVFVRYSGCQLEVLYECRDETNATAFGTYGVPQPTSGTRQGFDIENEGDLYASLPLGAAKLGGRVTAGESLHLEYFVAAVATASRDAIYQGEIQRVGGCAEATHFVWAYNLGAFELASAKNQSAEVDASVAGFGAGGSRKNKESNLGKGGELTSCSTNDQRACRVPIRLALRPVKAGNHPSDGGLAAGPPPGAPPASANAGTVENVLEQAKATQNANAVMSEANSKFYEDHDGKACTSRLERAMQIDSRIVDAPGGLFPRLHALCTMASGKCDDGAKMFRDFIKGKDDKRIRTDADIEQEVRRTTNEHCPSSTAKNDVDKLLRLGKEGIKVSKAGDSKRGKAMFGEVEKLIPTVQEGSKKSDRNTEAGRNETGFAQQAVGSGKGALREITNAVAMAEGCSAGLALYKRSYRLDLPSMPAAQVDKIAGEAWETMKAQKHVDCK